MNAVYLSSICTLKTQTLCPKLGSILPSKLLLFIGKNIYKNKVHKIPRICDINSLDQILKSDKVNCNRNCKGKLFEIYSQGINDRKLHI